jgi:DNA-binding GntR family transcriptional regulator
MAGSGGGRAARRTDVAYAHIKHELAVGRFGHGDALPVEAFVSELAMSRQPVMEAMKRLAMEGYVDIIPQVGCRVTSPRLRDIADFFRLFAASEALLAELAAERCEPLDVTALRAAARALGDTLSPEIETADGSRCYRERKLDFHGAIHAIARSPLLARSARISLDRLNIFVSIASIPLPYVADLRDAQDEHDEIAELIVAGQPPAAGQAMMRHFQDFGDHIVARMTSDDEAASTSARASASRR